MEAVVLRTLITVTVGGGGRGRSESASAVRGIALRGVGLRDAAADFLTASHGLPSSGDWALPNSAALYADNTVNFTIHGEAMQVEPMKSKLKAPWN